MPQSKEKEKQKKPESMVKSGGLFIWEIAKIVIISLAIILPIRYFLIQPFYVKGASMEPTFYDHQYLLIDEISYRFSPPQRGDVVVFRYPNDPSQFFIKRVIGLPGEKIEIINNTITIFNNKYPDGVILKESYLDKSVTTAGDISVQLSNNEYYLLGDNRNSSLDSRFFGPVQKKFLVGRTWIRVWPFNEFKQFNQQAYNL